MNKRVLLSLVFFQTIFSGYEMVPYQSQGTLTGGWVPCLDKWGENKNRTLHEDNEQRRKRAYEGGFDLTAWTNPDTETDPERLEIILQLAQQENKSLRSQSTKHLFGITFCMGFVGGYLRVVKDTWLIGALLNVRN